MVAFCIFQWGVQTSAKGYCPGIKLRFIDVEVALLTRL